MKPINIIHKLNEGVAEYVLSNKASGSKEVNSRINMFKSAIDDLCSKSNTKKVGNLKKIDCPYETSIDGEWRRQDLILPDGSRGHINFDALNNSYYTSFDDSDIYTWCSGVASFRGNLDYLTGELNNPEKFEELNREYSRERGE